MTTRPPLPEPDGWAGKDWYHRPATTLADISKFTPEQERYTASQMHAYADTCVAAETAALRVELDDAESLCVAKQSEIDALRTLHHEQAARIKVLDQDAERYRWLRAHRHYSILIEGFGFSYAQVEHWSNAQNEDKVDAAIDAARAHGIVEEKP